MPRHPASPSLTVAAALALVLAAALPGPAAAQDIGYYGMRDSYGQGFTVPSGRIWSANPRTGRTAGAGWQGQTRGMSQTMGRPAVGFPQGQSMGQIPDPFQPDPFQRGGYQQRQVQPQAPAPAPAGAARNPGFQPLPGSPGTTGPMGGMAAAPQMMPSPNGMQLQQPNRANLRVDNRVGQPGATVPGN